MLSRLISINLTYNSWFSLLILFTILVIGYVVIKKLVDKALPEKDHSAEYLTQVNRDLIKIDTDLKSIKEKIDRL